MALPVREPALGCRQQSVQHPDGVPECAGAPSGDVTGDEDAGERDVLVLADVAELVVGGDPAVGGPLECGIEVAVCQLHSGPIAATGRTGGEKSVS